MSSTTTNVALVFALCLYSAGVRADVIVSTGISLNNLQILPANGALVILPGVLASASAQAQDSLGGNDAQSNTFTDAAASANALTALANANAASSAMGLTASATSGVNIPQITAFASSGANGAPFGSLFGQFEIVGTTGPVAVQLRALLDYTQSLSTTGGGVSASSEDIFNLLLPEVSGSPVLFFDNLLTIGPNDSMSAMGTRTLSAFVTLDPGTTYNFIAEVDSESSGLSQVPEPSSLFLVLTAFVFSALLFARRERGRRRVEPNAR